MIIVNEHGIIQFDKEKVVGVAKIEIVLTEIDIDNIVVTAMEGGIGYWAKIVKNDEDWKEKALDVAPSQWVTKLLLDRKSVKFADSTEEFDDEEEWILTLDKVIKGFELNYKERPHDNDLENMDADTADCIIQYALFGKIVFG